MSEAPQRRICKKHKFIADGLFYAELNTFFTRELAVDGYSGVEVRQAPLKTEIVIRATHVKNVLGEKGRRIKELTAVICKRFSLSPDSIELFAERVNNRGLCAISQAESLRYKLLHGLAVRRACYGVMRYVMESEAKGCEIIISGKLRSQRAKAMKFCDGYMKKSGQASQVYVDKAVRSVLLKSGVLGIKVAIMLPWDPLGKKGPKTPLPDVVKVLKPKKEDVITFPPVSTTTTTQPAPVPTTFEQTTVLAAE
jgi:ribosomal protein uS3